MVTHTVRNSFNKHGSLFLHDKFTGLLGGEVDGEQVITIHSDSGHAVSNTTSCNTIACVLVIDGCRDGVHVVAAVEERLAAERGCEVKSRMEVTFRGGSFSKVGDSNAVVSPHTIVVASTGCLRELGAKR